MNCFYCGKRKTSRSIFYKLDKEGHEICQSCMRQGYAKSALEIVEHNKQVDKWRCENYCGVSCADGSCPIANRDEYAERGYDIIRSCGECAYYKGCEDCAFDGTEYCKKTHRTMLRSDTLGVK